MAKTTIAAGKGKIKEAHPRAQTTKQEVALVEELVATVGWRKAAAHFSRLARG